MVFRKLPWSLSCVLFTMAASAQLFASNETTALGTFNGALPLQDSNGANLTQLVPLTRDAIIRNNAPLKANLFNTDQDSVQRLSSEDISYISCDPGDYTGYLGSLQLFEQAMNQHNLTAVILYNTHSDFCGFNGTAGAPLQEFPVFSMTNRVDSQKILNATRNPTASEKYFVTISRVGGSDRDGDGRQQQQNPLGPSPSTAVAMIILYSITGIITALFLVIIVTGAVRAHRHPDRYGPRDVLGRPRQSRARGLGRAILDTLPIVKFGERDPPKPTDVEMASTAEARNVNTETETEAQNKQPTTETTATPASTQEPQDAVTVAEEQSGIAPAQPLTNAAAVAAANPSSAEEGLGCSICTDDFEKGQDIRVLPCNHKFHPECVDPWLLNVSGTCPLCRVDLRPTTSRTSAGDGEQDPDELAPPLQPETDPSHRRRSALREILSLRHRPNASTEERVHALRRLREQRHNQSGDIPSTSDNGSTENVAAARRSRRISARLSGVFNPRSRRHGQEDSAEPASVTAPTVASAEPSDPVPHTGEDSSELPSQRRS